MDLDQALAGVSLVVDQLKQAARDCAAARAEADTWRAQYEQERERAAALEAALADAQARLKAAQKVRRASTHLSQRTLDLPARSMVRRNTISLGRQLVGAGAEDGVLQTASSLQLRLGSGSAQQDQLQAGQLSPPGLQRTSSLDGGGASGASGALTLSRLGRMLGVCLLLETAAAAEAGPLERRDSMLEDVGQAQVSMLDDGGGAGVGATAAAAVSVALAKSWAVAAGASHNSTQQAQQQQQQQQLGRLHSSSGGNGSGGSAEGGGVGAHDHPGQGGAARTQPQPARFKLMAAVPRSQSGRERKLRTSESRVSLAGESSAANGSPSGAAATAPDTPTTSHGGGSAAFSGRGSGLFPAESAVALDSLVPSSPRGSLDDAQEATWRAAGCHLKLQWMSPPSTVLLVHKPAPAVFAQGVHALAWLLRRGLRVFVEPGEHAELARALAEELESGAAGRASGSGAECNCSEAMLAVWGSGGAAAGGGSAHGSAGGQHSAGLLHASDRGGSGGHHGSPLAPRPPKYPSRSGSWVGAAASPPESPAHAAHTAGTAGAAAPAVDLSAQLLTWDPCSCCDNAMPSWVAEQLDLAITLGGDGTVLWTCSMFSSGAVPPIVPFAMGSLGFMTPFPIECMEAVLSRTTTPEAGFPIMLRHRLQCRILRAQAAGASVGDLQELPPPTGCLHEEMVVLNEVVIDRGTNAWLTNLQVYVDQNLVTVVQGDGLIVATPTGSTAYSLAAGGSMVHPAVPAMLFTPICPHTISSRPLVFPEHVVLRVKVPVDSRSESYCSFDGRARQRLNPGDSVLIRMSQWPVPMVCSLDASHDWFLSVREGLNWNLRKTQGGKGQ